MSWIIIFTTIVALIGGGSVYASENALPGDTLYPLKIWVEDTRLELSSENSAADLGIAFMDKRMDEMVMLIDRGRVDDLEELAVQYQNRTNLVTRTIMQLQNNQTEDAARYRLLLQERLQEHARVMTRYAEIWEDHPGATAQIWMREMLHTRLENQNRASDDLDTIPYGEPHNNQHEGEYRSPDDAPPAGVPNGQFFEDGGLKYRFRSFSGTEGGIYAEISGLRYGCAAEGQDMVCDLTNAPYEGNLLLYNLRGELLFSTAFTYRWQLQNREGENLIDEQNLWLWDGEKNNGGQGSGNRGGGSGGGK